jgi:hypothetical protein
MRIGDFGAFAEQSIALVEEKAGIASFCGRKDAFEILLGLADILADDPAQVDPVERQAELPRDYAGAERFARAGRAGKERRQTSAGRQFGTEAQPS